MESLAKMKDEMSEKFSDVSLKVDSLNENITVSDTGGQEKFKRVEENFNALQTALRDIQSDNSSKIQKVADFFFWILLTINPLMKVAEDTRSSRDLLTWMEARVKESKVRIMIIF